MNYKGKYLIEMASSPYFIISICPVDMNVYARFDEIPSMTLKDIMETICYIRMDACTDNMKTVYIYPPTNTVRRVKIIHVMHCLQY